MSPVIGAFPGDADLALAVADDEVRVGILLLVVVGLDGEVRLDGERIKFTTEAAFRLLKFTKN